MKFLVVVVITAVIISLLFVPDTPISGSELKLGTGGYDIIPLVSPVLKGTPLEIFANLFSVSKLGPFIKRFLLNQNKIHMLRELSAQVEVPPLHFPLYRMNKQEREEQQRLAASPDGDITKALENGIGAADKTVLPSVNEYAHWYRTLEAKPSDVMKRAIAAVRSWEKEGFVIFSSLIEEDILNQAYESDKRHAAGQPLSIFDGVPVAIKDQINVRGHPKYDGKHPTFPTEVRCENDDIIVERFRALGAIIFGVTLMTEGGTSPLGFNAHYQGPFNPYNTHYYSGGSSSGSAVAVATGIVPVAVGFDGGGSVRLPSTFSGIHGLATTWGRVAHAPGYSTVTKAGPMTNNAADAALAYAVMAPNHETHFYGQLYDGGILGTPEPHLHGFDNTQDLSDVRLGIFKEWFDDSDPEVRQLCQAAVDFMVSRGATVVPISIPHLQWMSLAHSLKIASEFAAVFDTHLWNHHEKLEPNTRIVVGIGSTVTALEVLSGEYLRAYGFDYVRNLYTSLNLTAIVTPTAPTVAPAFNDDVRQCGESNSALAVKTMKFIYIANFLGLAGYSVPVGFASAADDSNVQLPVGLQLIGKHWDEHKLLRLAHSIEQGHTSALKRPKTIHSFNPFHST